jgi:hypothetical protein
MAGRYTGPLNGMTGSYSTDASLRNVKIVHTLVWALFAGCIVALPIVAWLGDIRAATLLIAIVGFEVLVLIINRFRCPLTGIAARYTQDRRDNFDIYLPLWLARYNKQIFGSLYVAGIFYTVVQWKGMRS